MQKIAIVFTTINAPNRVSADIAKGSLENGWNFIVAGDTKTPDFQEKNCQYLDIDAQIATKFKFAEKCPTKVYARKNVAFLQAIRQGAEIIVETDDDNIPREDFWSQRQQHQTVKTSQEENWVNVYQYFTETFIWPRGYDIANIRKEFTKYEDLPDILVNCPIQNGLADVDPDVDAMYRLTLPLPVSFEYNNRRLAIGKKTWCPFNSQNTTTFKDAFPLLYLPSYCSWRMTDIWRSFVAQRILWENDWHVLFHEPTVWQDRNDHDLMKDFREETIGYNWNGLLCEKLEDLTLKSGTEYIGDNMRKCYEVLIDMNLCDSKEIPLLNAWLQDLDAI